MTLYGYARVSVREPEDKNLDLVVEGDTLVVTHIDRLSRGLTHGLQVIEGLHRAGVEFRSLSEDFNTAMATGKLQVTTVLAFSEWWRNLLSLSHLARESSMRTSGVSAPTLALTRPEGYPGIYRSTISLTTRHP